MFPITVGIVPIIEFVSFQITIYVTKMRMRKNKHDNAKKKTIFSI